jgi:Domain of unknown function (DUF4190)
MTAPGDAFGESSHSNEVNPPPAGYRAPEQPDWQAPGDPPTPPHPADYLPPAYQPVSYPTGYPVGYLPGHQPDYPPQYAPQYPPLDAAPPGYLQPPDSAPPGYPQPPGYGGSPYPPCPPGPQFGALPGAYWQPSNPGDYYSPPDYRGGYGFPGPTRSAVNGLAIGSLISSFTGLFCCVGSIVAMVLGAIALNQIKRTRQDGFALAVAGIAIGIAGLLVTFVVIIFALQSH